MDMDPLTVSPSVSPVLQVTDLTKCYAGVAAVDGVSFEVRRGEVVGLLGLNGAGKTTIINMILGVLEPTRGQIDIDSLNLAGNRAAALSRTNFAAVYAPLPGNLTVLQNLQIFGMLYNVGQLSKRIDVILEQFGLERFRHTKCGVLSSGEQTKVCLAKAMLNQPPLLLLDEPTASLDPSTAQMLRRQIKEVASANHMGVLWTSHNMYEVEEICDRVMFLSHGKIMLQGNPKTLPGEHGKATMEALFIAVAAAEALV